MPISFDVIKEAAIEDQLTSYIMFVAGEGRVCLPFRPTSARDKDAMIEAARETAKHVKPEEVWMVCEAWAAVVEAKEGQNIREARAELPRDLADAPQKIELLVCQRENAKHGTELKVFTIARDDDDKICELTERDGLFSVTQNNMWILREPEAPVTH